jgi:hypothetical protein
MFIGYEQNQAQDLAVDAARGRHARRRDSRMLTYSNMKRVERDKCEVCLLKEQRHWPLQNQTTSDV